MGIRVKGTPRVMRLRPGPIQTPTGTSEFAKAPVILQPIGQRRTHTMHQGTPASQRTTMPIRSITPPTAHQMITILELRGIAKRDDMQLNCCLRTTPDIEYNPEIAST